jgi:hypothetical protein
MLTLARRTKRLMMSILGSSDVFDQKVEARKDWAGYLL